MTLNNVPNQKFQSDIICLLKSYNITYAYLRYTE